ncbi:MAG: permease [Planctomycetes bacterium]|nr:permease [Planctomycetota bacterium]
MPNDFLNSWNSAATTSLGLFWMAFWAFGLGFVLSSMIQAMTRERMKQRMGEAGAKSVLFGSFFGFVSSSCSFAALATTRSLFAKGAGLIPALAFLLASTNLVIELCIVIAVFLSWQFVVGENVGAATVETFETLPRLPKTRVIAPLEPESRFPVGASSRGWGAWARRET